MVTKGRRLVGAGAQRPWRATRKIDSSRTGSTCRRRCYSDEYFHRTPLRIFMYECSQPRLNGVSMASAVAIGLLILTASARCSAQDKEAPSSANPSHNDPAPGANTCRTEDLNHSVLIECNATSCVRPGAPNGVEDIHMIEWPSQPSEIIHVYSTRAGARFAQAKLPNLDFREDDESRMLDINTTLYVDSGGNLDQEYVKKRKLVGFGATIDFSKLERALSEDKFQQLFGPIFDDLFGRTGSRAQLTILRLQVDVGRDQQQDLEATLLKLDEQAGKRVEKAADRLRLMIDLVNLSGWDAKLGLEKNSIQSMQHTEIWAVSLDGAVLNREGAISNALRDIRENLPDALLFFSADLEYLVDLVTNTVKFYDADVQGVLVRSQPSVPYSYLEFSRENTQSELRMITAARANPRTKHLGDWRNAQNSAVELLNHLKYSSNGYIEDKSVIDVLCDPADPSDASLYSLHQDHGLHLRGPKFYALGHFSRFLGSGSLPLKTELFTQQNMFAAHYAAFMSADKQYIVGIVLNENEHLLPFRMAVDRQITLVSNLEPKSFNTFLIKLKG